MTERSDIGGRSPGRQPAEGVRIIPAEEAQAAIDKGEAAGRRPDDELRYGDVPPAPPGPRPAHRFPLPDSIDPAEAVPLPPLAPQRSAVGREPGGQAEWDFGDRTAEMDPSPPSVSPSGEHPVPPPTPAEVSPDEGFTVTGSGTELPHWTDPPTGEVPRILPGDDLGEDSGEDDLDAWRALGRGGSVGATQKKTGATATTLRASEVTTAGSGPWIRLGRSNRTSTPSTRISSGSPLAIPPDPSLTSTTKRRRKRR